MYDKIVASIEAEKIIVIVRGAEKEKLIPLAQAMYDGGIRLLEVTFDAKGVVTDEQTAENIASLVKYFDGKMLIGAGTVLKTSQVELVAKAGGSFIISPNTNEAVIKKTRELGMVSMPGAVTPSEIQLAHEYGASFVKLFPAGNLGPDYVKAIKAPLSHIKLTAVGGIHDGNMADYLKAGASGFGIGTNIVDKKLLEAEDYAGITKLAEKYVAVVK